MNERCHNHPDVQARGPCHSCGRYFCFDCLSLGLHHYYCRDPQCQSRLEDDLKHYSNPSDELSEQSTTAVGKIAMGTTDQHSRSLPGPLELWQRAWQAWRGELGGKNTSLPPTTEERVRDVLFQLWVVGWCVWFAFLVGLTRLDSGLYILLTLVRFVLWGIVGWLVYGAQYGLASRGYVALVLLLLLAAGSVQNYRHATPLELIAELIFLLGIVTVVASLRRPDQTDQGEVLNQIRKTEAIVASTSARAARHVFGWGSVALGALISLTGIVSMADSTQGQRQDELLAELACAGGGALIAVLGFLFVTGRLGGERKA